MFTTIEISKWRFGLVQHVDYDRVIVVHSIGKSTPEREFISVDDVKTGKAEIELLG